MELGGEEAALLAIRTLAIALVLAGAVALVALTCRKSDQSEESKPFSFVGGWGGGRRFFYFITGLPGN